MKICWAHWDLDGIVSYIVLKWFHPNETIELKTSRAGEFEKDWNNWSNTVDISKYETIYVLDLDVSEHAKLVDHKNVTIIDHHKSHVNEYKKATALVKVYTSAAKLIYKIMTKLHPEIEITDAQKKLVIYTDDYDCYKLDFPESKDLNDLFFHTQKATEMFLQWFSNGFHGFNHAQLTIIKQYKNLVDSIKKNLSVYANKIKIQGKERYICAAFASDGINDIADTLKDEYGAEIAIVVNIKNNSVSYRKWDEESDLDLSKLAEALSEGGGHKYAAGGKITEKFMEFTKLLRQIK